MNSPSGDAPVYLHDLLHALQTAMGARPRPASGKSGDMVPVPVEVYLLADTGDGAAGLFALDLTGWRLQPHKPATNGAPEVPARLYFTAALPAPFTLNNPTAAALDPDPPAAAPDPEPVAYDPSVPPELRHLDPAVWTADTSRPAGFGAARKGGPTNSSDGGAP